jgi:hypothetical protein
MVDNSISFVLPCVAGGHATSTKASRLIMDILQLQVLDLIRGIGAHDFSHFKNGLGFAMDHSSDGSNYCRITLESNGKFSLRLFVLILRDNSISYKSKVSRHGLGPLTIKELFYLETGIVSARGD